MSLRITELENVRLKKENIQLRIGNLRLVEKNKQLKAGLNKAKQTKRKHNRFFPK